MYAKHDLALTLAAAHVVVFDAGVLDRDALVGGLLDGARAHVLDAAGGVAQLAGILEGTRFFSVRQATLGVAAGLTGERRGDDVLEPATSVVILVVVTIVGFVLTARALQRFQVRAGD